MVYNQNQETLNTCPTGGGKKTPIFFIFRDDKKAACSAAAPGKSEQLSIWHILTKFQVKVMSGHRVKTSFLKTCKTNLILKTRLTETERSSASRRAKALEILRYIFHQI